jgi:hypothetical protein
MTVRRVSEVIRRVRLERRLCIVIGVAGWLRLYFDSVDYV